MSALDDVATERRRQIENEGWSVDHDDKHERGEMALAAACYAIHSADETATYAPPYIEDALAEYWPWDRKWWKPKERRHDLVRAAALLIAEIERLDREF